MLMKWIAPSMLWAARLRKAAARKAINSLALISPAAMANSRCLIAPLPPTFAIDRNIVRRIGKDHLSLFTRHQGRDQGRIAGVAANEAMWAQLPNVSQTAAWLLGIKPRQNVICRIARFFVSQSLDQMVDLGNREAGELNVEVEVTGRELFELEGQELIVPAGVECDLVVGKDIGSLLGCRHAVDAKAWDGLHPQKLGGFDTTVTSEDLVVSVDQNRVGEAEALDAVGDLPDLFPRMSPGVSGIGAKVRDRFFGDTLVYGGHSAALIDAKESK